MKYLLPVVFSRLPKILPARGTQPRNKKIFMKKVILMYVKLKGMPKGKIQSKL